MRTKLVQIRNVYSKHRSGLGGLAIIAGFGLLGFGFMTVTHAATYTASIEAETGTVSGNGVTLNDVTASGGKSVKFGSIMTQPPSGYVVNLTDFGATCDGSHNDQPALQAAVSDVSAKGGGTVMVPAKTCRMVQTAGAVFTSISGNVAIQGVSNASTLALDTDVQGAYRELFRISGGTNVKFDTLNMVRASNVYGIFVDIYNVNGLTLNNVVMDGKKGTIGGADIHGIAVFGAAPNKVSNVMMSSDTIKGTDFGMFQDSSVTTIVDGWTVDHSTFSDNYDDDLEFNAPNSSMSNVNVTNSTFTNNHASDTSAPSGFAIGFANVQHGSIKNNIISGYNFDPLHIEDRSSDITVDGNQISKSFLSAATNYASYLFIINRSHDIRITNNTFDASANTNPLDCIYLGQGGGSGPVSNVTISGNTFKIKTNAKAIGQYGTSNVTVGTNTTISL